MAGIANAAVAVGGGVLTSVANSSAKNGGSSSAKPYVVSMQHGPISIPSVWGSSLACTPSRIFSARVGLQPVACAQVNEVAVENHVHSSAKLGSLPEMPEEGIKEEPPVEPPSQSAISALMSEVANLVKLVDSRDIVELELKSKDYELIIRKEAQQPPAPPMTFPGPHVMAHTTFPGYPPPPPPAPVAAPAPVASPPPPEPTPAAPSHPPMLSPMAGTFYRSPGPGEPAFVKVGDRVTKGQVVCIVEAMKLMNEIEADQSGTILEILAEDGKPISMETPLFSIKA
ncbi:unnamed protein product [Calypogeia fissa]